LPKAFAQKTSGFGCPAISHASEWQLTSPTKMCKVLMGQLTFGAVRMHWQAKVQPNCKASQKINAAQLAGDPTETISGSFPFWEDCRSPLSTVGFQKPMDWLCAQSSGKTQASERPPRNHSFMILVQTVDVYSNNYSLDNDIKVHKMTSIHALRSLC